MTLYWFMFLLYTAKAAISPFLGTHQVLSGASVRCELQPQLWFA